MIISKLYNKSSFIIFYLIYMSNNSVNKEYYIKDI